MIYGNLKVVPPRKRALAKPKPEKLKPRSVTHRVFGVGELRAVRASESGGYIVECDFGGTMRTLQLRQEFWAMPIVSVLKLIGHLPPPAPKPESESVENDVSSAPAKN